MKNIINKIDRDEFGRPSGVLAINKPADITSHDVVDKVRKALKTRKVGHAGALDVFATGVLIILVGKFTKKTEELINKDKSYLAQVLFGVATTTQDTEGEISKIDNDFTLDKVKLETALAAFEGTTEQYVSAYSSVKVDGEKLRVRMRDKRYNVEIINKDGSKFLSFEPKAGEQVEAYEIEIPKREVKMYDIKLNSIEKIAAANIPLVQNKLEGNYFTAEIEISCSKGTYIRQFAEDLAEKLGTVGMLIALTRTAVADIDIEDAIELDQLESL